MEQRVALAEAVDRLVKIFTPRNDAMVEARAKSFAGIAVCYEADDIRAACKRLERGEYFPKPVDFEVALHAANVESRRARRMPEAAKDWSREFDVLSQWLTGFRWTVYTQQWLAPPDWCIENATERSAFVADKRLADLVNEADPRAIAPIWRAILDERHIEDAHDLNPLSYDIRKRLDDERQSVNGPHGLKIRERIARFETRANTLWGEGAYDMKSAA